LKSWKGRGINEVKRRTTRTFYQKKKKKGGRDKWDTKDLNAIRGAIKFNKGDKPKR
jgi:hypothetical protein